MAAWMAKRNIDELIEEGDNGEERDNDRNDETEEQKATREYYERSVELERLRCS